MAKMKKDLFPAGLLGYVASLFKYLYLRIVWSISQVEEGSRMPVWCTREPFSFYYR